MKGKIFTLVFCALIFGGVKSYAQINTGTGIEWGTEYFPGSPLVVDENFQGFDFFYTDENPDQGNSDNTYDPNTGAIVYGYKNDTTEVLVNGSSSVKVKYYFDQCAFAPDWATAYAYADDGDNSGNSNTPNVSNGFVEVSRDYPSDPPTVRGYFTVDLRALDYVDGIQWSHSSTGGNKRGVMCEFSTDDGATWDTLRYQPGGASVGFSFTKDVTTGMKTSNTYRCDPSAYGMTWEDGIYYSGGLMLRFMECGGQTPRIHDLKIYGTFTPTTSSANIKEAELKISSLNKEIRISELAKVAVYNISGVMVKSANKTNLLQVGDLPNGIYLVKAQAGSKIKTSKIYLK